MSSESFRIVVLKVDRDRVDEVIYELGRAFDVSFAEAKELVAELPVEIDDILEQEEAESLSEKLKAAGAKVRLEAADDEDEVDDDEVPEEALADEDEEDEEGEEDDEEYEDEDEEYDDEEYEDERPRRGRSSRGSRRAKGRTPPSSQRMAIYVGGGLFLLVAIMLLVSRGGGGCSLGGGQFRGAGANEQLAGLLPRVAGRFARGFTADDEVAHGVLEANESAMLNESLAGGFCYVWIGLSPDGTDLDLFLRDGGTVVSEDQAQDNFPIVQHCVGEDSTLDLEVKMYTGRSDWVVQRYSLEGREGADQIELLHLLHSQRLLGAVEPASELQRFSFGNGQEKVLRVELDPEWCYVPLAVSRPGTDLDLFLIDSEGRVLEQDEARDNFPMLRHCPIKAGEYGIRVLMYGGESDVVYRLYRGKLSDQPPAPSEPPALKNR